MIVLENVAGALSSHKGKDFATICKALCKEGYAYGAIVVDAALFLPQSRPRLFIIAVKEGLDLVDGLIGNSANPIWHTRSLKNAYCKLGKKEQERWVWWNLNTPETSEKTLSEIIDDEPEGVVWHTPQQTKQLIQMMSEINLAKLEEAKKSGRRTVGTIYKRTRRDQTGRKVQRAEVRFDGIAGCLRTPTGGSSRQLIIVVKGKQIKTRLIATRETARLMGLEESYVLPQKYNEAYHLTGDGVVVPVVRYLSEQIFEPILLHNQRKKAKRKVA